MFTFAKEWGDSILVLGHVLFLCFVSGRACYKPTAYHLKAIFVLV